MSNVPVQLVVAAFQDEDSAKQALKELQDAQRRKLIKIEDAAVLRKDEKGKLHVNDLHDWGGGKGAVVGGLLGAGLGLLLGPLVLVGAAGALVGGLSAKLRDSGFNDTRLKKLGEGLEPGTSAILAVVEHRWVAQVEAEIEAYAMDVLTEDISADIAEQLQAGKELAYSAIGTDDGISINRTAVGEDQMDVEQMTITDETVTESRAVITEQGIAAERLTQTEDADIYDAVVATEEGIAAGEVIATNEGVVAGMVAATAEELAEGEVEDEESEDTE